MWDQIKGQRESCEIEIDVKSMVLIFIEMRANEGIADNYGGQNRNRNIATMYIYALHTSNINTITHWFYKSGHSLNENDSIHGVIEKAKKNIVVYVPEQCFTLVAGPRVTQDTIQSNRGGSKSNI